MGTVEEDELEVVADEHLKVLGATVLARLEIEAAHVVHVFPRVALTKYLLQQLLVRRFFDGHAAHLGAEEVQDVDLVEAATLRGHKQVQLG